MTGLIEGLGFEEVNQSTGYTDIVYAATVSGTVIQGTTVSGTTVGGATVQGTSIYGSTVVSGATVKGTNISGTGIVDSNGKLESVATGSPYSFGKLIRGGTGTLGAGSSVWVVFPVKYTAAPTVVVTTATTQDNGIGTGSYSVGSFFAWGKTASDTFTWISL
jgi:hypothetical protein